MKKLCSELLDINVLYYTELKRKDSNEVSSEQNIKLKIWQLHCK